MSDIVKGTTKIAYVREDTAGKIPDNPSWKKFSDNVSLTTIDDLSASAGAESG